MYKKKILKLFYEYRNLFIISSFIILSILSTTLLVHAHFLGAGGDTYFHWQRLNELRTSFNNLHFFPNIALNNFDYGNGSAVMSLYPYQNLLPIILLSYLFKSDINLIYFSFSLYTLFALIISYYSSLHINHRIDTSYLFSIMYSMSAYMITHGFQSMDLGILFSTIALPLIIFGFIELLQYNYWLELSFGLTLIIFSHVLNSVFAFIFLAIWLLINIKKFNLDKIISLIKCIILTFITTAIFIFPFLKIILLNKISKPFPFSLCGHDFIEIIDNAFNNHIGDYPGLLAILGAIIIPILFYRKFNSIIKQMYWLSIIIMVICSNIFPWGLLQNSFVQFIQFSWRLYFIPQLLLTYIFALGVTKYLNKTLLRQRMFLAMILFTILLQVSAQAQIIDRRKNTPELINHAKMVPLMPNNGDFKMSTSNQVNNLSYGFSSNDYFPEQSLKFLNFINTNKGINLDNYSSIQFYSLGNDMSTFYNHNKINELNVPFLGYKGIKYQAYLDNHPIPFKVNKTKLFTLNNVQKGKHYIKIRTVPNISDIIVRILFFIGILIYLWLFFIKYFNKHKLLK